MISKLKYTLLTMLLAAFVAQPALASPLNNDDMAFAFGDSSSVSSDLGEMALLSDQEMMDTEGEWIPFAIAAFNAYRYGRYLVGPARAWLRVGRSYSRSGGFRTTSLRWGSNSHYRNSIGSTRLRNLNARLHNSRLPGSSWRSRDPGHYHFRRW